MWTAFTAGSSRLTRKANAFLPSLLRAAQRQTRSGERRVGEEGRFRWAADPLKKKRPNSRGGHQRAESSPCGGDWEAYPLLMLRASGPPSSRDAGTLPRRDLRVPSSARVATPPAA